MIDIKTVKTKVLYISIGIILGGVLSQVGGLKSIPLYDTPELFNVKGKYTVRCDKPDGTSEVIKRVSVWEGDKGTTHYVNLKDKQTIKLGNECILYNIGML